MFLAVVVDGLQDMVCIGHGVFIAAEGRGAAVGLHRQQIEVVDYSEENARYFDLMPGASAGTIRPALIADGSLLKKGLASKGN